MFNRIKDFFSSKSKEFKILAIIILIAVVITAKIIDENKADDDKTPSSSADTKADTNDNTEEQTGIHIGIGHIVMLIVFTAAYGIDRVIVYRNNLKDEQKFDNYKEK